MFSFFEDLKPFFQLVATLPAPLLFLGALFLFLLFAIKWDSNRYLLCQINAVQQLKRLKCTNTHAEKITALRGVNPLVFEEMILTALKRQGHKIKRNKRYSHDGGIDGAVIIKNTHYLIQAKRYTNHINPKHVQDFINICVKRRTKGLFIHTGITGKKSKDLVKNSNIEIIDGKRLTNMLTNQHRRTRQPLK